VSLLAYHAPRKQCLKTPVKPEVVESAYLLPKTSPISKCFSFPFIHNRQQKHSEEGMSSNSSIENILGVTICDFQLYFVTLQPKLLRYMENIKSQFARQLMDIKAIKLQPQEPFTWASGWKSPIYTDNRKTLSFPRLRSFVKLELCHTIQENFPEVEAVAGVATGAIAQGALVAEELGLPYSYVRPKPKDHGMGNQVEGEIEKGAKVVVVEDLISTGGSSLKAVEALRQYGVEVIGMVASFTYGFPVAEEAFRKAGVKLITLSDYQHVVEEAAKTGYIKEEDKAVLAEWRENPSEWMK
jgi:orotate phosphoribosyltransferase